MASQAKGAVKETAEHVSMQLLLRRESLFDLKDRVALVTGKAHTIKGHFKYCHANLDTRKAAAPASAS